MAPGNVDLALADAADLKKTYLREVVERVNPRVVEQFVNYLRTQMRVGINCRAPALVGFLTDGEYKNIHRLVEEGKEPDSQYGYRIFAEDHLGFGNDIVYGSLNSGNCGARFHGDYCIILNNGAIRERVSFTRENSFKYMQATSVSTDLTAAIKSGYRATWKNVDQLAMVKIREELERVVPPYDVPAIDSAVCGFFDSIEAQISGKITLRDVDEVRIHHVEYLKGMLYMSRRDLLEEAQQIVLRTQLAAHAMLDACRVKIEIA